MTRPDPARTPVHWRSTTVDRWLIGGPAVVNGGSPPLTVVDLRRWPPMATVDRWYEVGSTRNVKGMDGEGKEREVVGTTNEGLLQFHLCS
ncbi:hypothetical protein Tco_1172496 [Tanacetum coccineum]